MGPSHSGNAGGADSFRRNLAKNMNNVFGRVGVTSSRPAWTAFFLVVCDIAVSKLLAV
jgi:hypothetical protein